MYNVLTFQRKHTYTPTERLALSAQNKLPLNKVMKTSTITYVTWESLQQLSKLDPSVQLPTPPPFPHSEVEVEVAGRKARRARRDIDDDDDDGDNDNCDNDNRTKQVSVRSQCAPSPG
jgi:hypothetical protein